MRLRRAARALCAVWRWGYIPAPAVRSHDNVIFHSPSSVADDEEGW